MSEKTIKEATKESFEGFIEEVKKQVKRLESKNDKTSEKAREEIEIEALEVATGKEFNGSKTYMILLGTGGPAMRITGDLNEYNEPKTANYQFQTWFTEWTSAIQSKEEEGLLLKYARCFYFEG